jgi:hypothetical protein
MTAGPSKKEQHKDMIEIERSATLEEDKFKLLEKGLLDVFKNSCGAVRKTEQYSQEDAEYSLAAAKAGLALIELYKMRPK